MRNILIDKILNNSQNICLFIKGLSKAPVKYESKATVILITNL